MTRLRLPMVGAVLALGAALTLSAQSSATDAGWNETTHATGSYTALTVARPALGATCTLSPGFLGTNPAITITWMVPPGSGFTSANAQYAISGVSGLEQVTGSLLSSITTTGPVGGVYTTRFGSGVLTGLLGGTKSVGVRFLHSSGWTSLWSQADASMGLAGANPQCTVVP
ncbi:hypothetical protein [Agromyces albus]|uniref:Uncharacterized protein n=1 Tax=Agromyces albus TaxID=205332 RepID=A0A4Q2L2D8_9MICO|nr:hypothetical protein [Agromyces albus]RXZ72274.1 hypothetical protein ESP51_05160 [Agromyces albus]